MLQAPSWGLELKVDMKITVSNMINSQVCIHIMKRDSWLMYAVSQSVSHAYGWTVVFSLFPPKT